MLCDTYHEQRVLTDQEHEKEDPGMAIFGCDFLQFLNRHVKLPGVLDEKTLFDEFHNQKWPLELRDKAFEVALNKGINEA